MPINSSQYAGLIRHDGQLADLYLDLKNMADILKLFPVTEIGRPRLSARLVDRLPEGGYRDLNENFTEDVGTTKPKEDFTAIYGGKFSVDIAFDDWTQEPMIADEVESNYLAHMRSTALNLTNDVINGDIDTNEKGFDGMQKRLENGDQDSANLIKCASASNLTARQSAAAAISYLEFLDEAMMEVGLYTAPEEGAVRGAILMNKTSYLGHQAAVKISGQTDTQVNLLGYTWANYNGVPIIRTPLLPDRTTEIIGNNISTSDSTGSTRIYIVRLASAPTDDGTDPRELLDNPGGDGFQLIQAGMLKRLEPLRNEMESVQHGYQWQLGVSTVKDSSCVAALENITFAKA